MELEKESKETESKKEDKVIGKSRERIKKEVENELEKENIETKEDKAIGLEEEEVRK